MATPSPYKESKMSIKNLVGKRVTKTTKFLDEDIVIRKLSIADVEQIQAAVKELEDVNAAYAAATKQYEADCDKARTAGEALPERPEEPEAQDNFSVLKTIIRSSTVDGDQLTDEDFQGFALDDLSKLSEEIMNFSGVGDKGRKGK